MQPININNYEMSFTEIILIFHLIVARTPPPEEFYPPADDGTFSIQ